MMLNLREGYFLYFFCCQKLMLILNHLAMATILILETLTLLLNYLTILSVHQIEIILLFHGLTRIESSSKR